MTLSRRDFARALASVAAVGTAVPRGLGALRPRPAPQETFFMWRAVGSKIHAAFGQGGNVVLVHDGGQALIVDSKNPGYGFTLRREAEALGGRLTQALNTHHHSDHVGGNAAFTSDLPLLAHSAARPRIRTWAEGLVGKDNAAIATALTNLTTAGRAGTAPVIAELQRAGEQMKTVTAERFLPTRDIGEAEEIRVGGVTVRLRHIGRGHTDNDVFLHFPGENVIHTGDLCFNGTHGFMDQDGGVSSDGWQRSVQAILALTNSDTVVIPGHGEITNRAGLQRQYDYFGQMRDAVTEAIRQGMTKEQVMALRPAAVADIMGNPSRNLGVVFDEVKGQ